ncbi:ABC transporter, ATP-binding protein [Candidatus Similichlamydia laticola]|uniref:ABC transporter, ATP-binding protein n=1 Tax=Candidatus Similichlamydia laticola TaxID=2170265 RepID=A0A369KJ58_9BACT|nr:ABC transporter, ATP-binding protein [Candidatus Similichlamydia laticola]
MKQASYSYGQETVLDNVSLEILRGERVVVIGNNGAGKTTLLKLLASVHVPTLGQLEIGHNVLPSYFPQSHLDAIGKDTDMSMFEWLRKHNTCATDQMLREALGRMLFSGDTPQKAIRSLSGGETARFVLAHMTLQEHNLLILDEPNNHMDIESVVALAQALRDYKGTVVVSSHDRDLIESVGTKIVSIENRQVTAFSGTFEEWTADQKGKKTKK